MGFATTPKCSCASFAKLDRNNWDMLVPHQVHPSRHGHKPAVLSSSSGCSRPSSPLLDAPFMLIALLVLIRHANFLAATISRFRRLIANLLRPVLKLTEGRHGRKFKASTRPGGLPAPAGEKPDLNNNSFFCENLASFA